MGKVFAEDYLDLFCEIHRIHDNKLLYTGHIAKINDVEKYVVVSGLTAFSGEKPEEIAIAIISRFRGISIFTADAEFIDNDRSVRLENIKTVTKGERRENNRVEVNLPAFADFGGNEKPVMITIRDMSVTGCKIATGLALDDDQTFKLHFTFNNTKLYTCECCVIRLVSGSKNAGFIKVYGCTFTNMSDDVLEAISNYVTSKRVENMKHQMFPHM